MAQGSMTTRSGLRETKPTAGNFHPMILAITGQWVAEVTGLLCLFGAACIGLAFQMSDGRGQMSDAGDQIEGRRSDPKSKSRSPDM
jgi:hypothetical protein